MYQGLRKKRLQRIALLMRLSRNGQVPISSARVKSISDHLFNGPNKVL